MTIGIQYDFFLGNKINQLCQMAQSFLDGGHEVYFIAVTKKPRDKERLMVEMQEKLFPHTGLISILLGPDDDEIEETVKAFQDEQVNVVFTIDNRVCRRLNDREILAMEIY